MKGYRFRIVLLMFMIIWLAVCGQAETVPPGQTTAGTVTSTPAASATSSATGLPVTGGGLAVGATETIAPPPTAYDMLKAGNSCNLINSQDLAHLFPPHNEIVRDLPKTGPVSHPPFSDQAAAGTETECVFLDFHQPGSDQGWMLQVTYRVDQPDPPAVATWSQAWTAAKEASGQLVENLGDEAFTSGTKLYIKKGDTYYTFEAADTHLDERNPKDVQQLLQYEKQLAAEGIK